MRCQDFRAGQKRCQEKGPPRERNQAKLGRNERYFNRKRSQEMRDVKIQSFQEEDMSRERGLKKNTCQEQGQRERTVKRKWCQEKETSRKRIVKRNKCQGCQALSTGAKRMGFQDSEPRKTAVKRERSHQARSSETNVEGKMDSKEMQVPSRFAGFRRLASCNGRKILQRNDWMIANRLQSLFPPNQDARQMMLLLSFYWLLLSFTSPKSVKSKPSIAVHHVIAPDPIRAPNRVESAQPRGGPNSGAGWPLLGCATPPPHLSYETLRNMAIGWDNSPGFSFFLIVKLLSNYCQTPV